MWYHGTDRTIAKKSSACTSSSTLKKDDRHGGVLAAFPGEVPKRGC